MPVPKDAEERRHQLTLDVLLYLVKHPDAKDTIVGVRRWWLPKGKPQLHEHELSEVLEQLVSQGWVVASTVAGSRVIYGLAKNHLKEIEVELEKEINSGRNAT